MATGTNSTFQFRQKNKGVRLRSDEWSQERTENRSGKWDDEELDAQRGPEQSIQGPECGVEEESVFPVHEQFQRGSDGRRDVSFDKQEGSVEHWTFSELKSEVSTGRQNLL